jgi:hypothetical protein
VQPFATQVARKAPVSASGYSRFAATDRRNRTGRWNTIACASARAAPLAQTLRPLVGSIRPWQSRRKQALPRAVRAQDHQAATGLDAQGDVRQSALPPTA